MSRRVRSAIWYHFSQSGPQRKAECRHCQHTISFAGGSTGNLVRHLKLKHPEHIDNGQADDESDGAAKTASKQDQREEETVVHGTPKERVTVSQHLQSLILSVTEETNDEQANDEQTITAYVDETMVDETVADATAAEEPNVNDGAGHLESPSTDAPSTTKLVWSDQETQHLLNLRLPMHSQFQQSNDIQHLWGVVAERLAALGVKVTSRDCDLKWRGILKTYQNSRKQAKKEGVDSVTWPYFDSVDNVLGGDSQLQSESEGDDVESNYNKEYGPRWSDQQTKHLLSLRMPLEAAFRKNTYKGKLWPRIATKMKRLGWEVEAADCSMKWKNILRTYNQIRGRSDTRGGRNVKWPYFKLIESHNAADISQQQTTFSDSDPGSPEVQTPMIRRSKRVGKPHKVIPVRGRKSPSRPRRLSASDSDEPEVQPALSRPRKRPTRAATDDETETNKAEAPSWFLEYMKQQDRREEQRWKEFVQLENEKQQIERDKLQAIEALTNILGKLVEKG